MDVLRKSISSLVILCACMACACFRTESHKSGQSYPSRQLLRLNIPKEPLSLDPRFGETRSQITIRMLFEGLTRIGPNGQLQPGIAESWEISPDGCVYTFKLREAYWSHGQPITAADFVYAWRSVVAPETGSPFAYLCEVLRNCEAVRKKEKGLEELGVRALDDRTLIVELEHPAPYFLGLLAQTIYSPLCAAVDQANPSWSSHGGSSFVSNGPFCMKTWDHGEHICFVKNPFYWDSSAVKVDQIDVSIIDDARTVLMMFERGELDWAGEPLSDLPRDALPMIREQGRLHTEPSGGIFLLQLNTLKAPFNVQSMRHAFANAVDRKALVERLLRGGENPACTVLLPRHSQFASSPVHDGDIALARQQFEEGLRELGLKREELPPIVLTYGAVESQLAIAQAIQQQWERAFDIPIVLEGCDWTRFISSLHDGCLQIGGLVWHSWLDDPMYNLEIVKYRGRGFNAAHWEHPDYLSLLNQADRENSEAERQQLLCSAEQFVMEALPLVPVFVNTHKYVKNPALQDVYISHLGQIDFKWAHFSPPEDSIGSPI